MSTVAEPESEAIGPDLYRIAVEEYRFQAQFNWNRVQYLLAFNAGILAAGVALANTSGTLAVVVFALGIVACGMTVLVQRVQHNYYRNARDRMRRIEKSLHIDDDAQWTRRQRSRERAGRSA